VVTAISSWRASHEEAGGVPAAVLDEIDEALANKVPAILDEDSAATASHRASELCERIGLLLGGSDQWLGRRQARRV